VNRLGRQVYVCNIDSNRVRVQILQLALGVGGKLGIYSGVWSPESIL
jgi:hypothetical protein